MRTALLNLSATSFVGILLVFSCKKTNPEMQPPARPPDSVQVQSVQPPFPVNPITLCTQGPDYGDSILYPQPAAGNDYVISPVNDPGPGTYLSWPAGLSINSTSGAIDITKSEAGERYAIGFVRAGSTDTCLKNIIISGTSYIDSVYALDQSDSMAAPYFNGNPDLPSICSGNGPGPNSCQFDIGDNAARHGINMDHHTGVIAFKNNFIQKVFGPFAYNGEIITTTFKYMLSDGNNTVQQLQIALVYYDRKSDIPIQLLDLINSRKNTIVANDVSNTPNTRPPLIVITRAH